MDITFTALFRSVNCACILDMSRVRSVTACCTRMHILRHLVHAGAQADHRGDDLGLLVAQILLEAALDHGHRFVGVRGRGERLLHQHPELRQLAILRLLQLLQLVLELRDVALKFLDFLAGGGGWRGRERKQRRQTAHAKMRRNIGKSPDREPVGSRYYPTAVTSARNAPVRGTGAVGEPRHARGIGCARRYWPGEKWARRFL